MTKKFYLTNYTSKDRFNREHRPYLTGIYHDGGSRIATDAFVMCVIKSKYPPEHEGKIIRYKGDVIEADYPDWKRAIPKLREIDIVTLDFESIRERTSKALKDAKQSGKMVLVDIPTKESSVYFEGNRMLLFLDFVSRFPDSKIYHRDDYVPITAQADNGNLCVLLATKYEKGGDFQVVV